MEGKVTGEAHKYTDEVVFEVLGGNFCSIVPVTSRGNKFIFEVVAIVDVVFYLCRDFIVEDVLLGGKSSLVEPHDKLVISLD